MLRDEHVPRKANTEAETKSWRMHATLSTKQEPHTVWAAHTDIMFEETLYFCSFDTGFVHDIYICLLAGHVFIIIPYFVS